MSESDRTSITLSKNLWDLIDYCIGVIGYNRSQVIGIILHEYFKNSENLETIKELRRIREETIKKQLRDKPKDIKNIENKIEKILNVYSRIKKQEFLDLLNVSNDYFQENFFDWSQKYNFIIDIDVIKKKN